MRALLLRHPDALPLLAVIAGFLLYTVLFFGLINQVELDVGRDFIVPELFLQGRVFYRDIFYQYGPLTPWLHALLFRLFGFSTTVILTAGAVAGFAIVLLTYFVARQILSPAAAAVGALLVLQHAIYGPHHVSYTTPYTFSGTYGVLFSLLTLFAASKALDADSRRWDLIGGFAAALAAASKQEFGVISLLVLLASMLARVPGAPRRALAAALAAGSSGLLVAAAIAVPLFRLVSLPQFLDNVYPRKIIEAWRLFYQNLQYWGPNAPAAIRESIAGFLLNFGFILAATGLLAALWDLLLGQRPALRTCLLLAFVGTPFIWLHRFPEYYPLLLHAIVLLHAATGQIPARRAKVAFLTCSAAIFLIRVLPGPMIHRSPFTLLYFIPSLVVYLYLCYELAVPRLARLFPAGGIPRIHAAMTAVFVFSFVLYPLVRTTYPWSRRTEPVVTGRGVVRLKAGYAARTRFLIQEIESRTRPGDKILLIPHDAMCYFLTGRQPASKWVDYYPGQLPDAEAEMEEIQRLRQNPPKLVIIDDAPQLNFFPGPARFGEGYNVRLGHWIRRNYREVQAFRYGDRWLRVLVPL